MLQKNDIIPLEITGTTAEGNGVGRHEGMAIFVPAAAEGDSLRVRILKVCKNYAFGKTEELLTPSPARIETDCPQFFQCGGCVFRHITYAEECRIKHQRVADAIHRIGGFADFPVQPLLPSPSAEGYRNKAQYPIGTDKNGRLTLGFFAQHSHRIVPCDDCKLQPTIFSSIAAEFLAWAQEQGLPAYDEATGKGRLRHLYLRSAHSGEKIMVCRVVNGNGLPSKKGENAEQSLVERLTTAFPQIESIILNSNFEKTNVILGKKCRTLWGQDTLTDTLCGLEFHISPLSFYQVNHDQTQNLYQLAADYAQLDGTQLLLDLYCGTGTIGLSMADRVKKLIGVEIIPQAIENAKENAARNGKNNCEFLCADAAQAAALLAKRGERPDVVVLDPPRKGCDPDLIDTVARTMSPQRVVYVSCDPATLARDLKLFCGKGYTLQIATPVDMFPRTAHVETVVLLSREKADDYVRISVHTKDLQTKAN